MTRATHTHTHNIKRVFWANLNWLLLCFYILWTKRCFVPGCDDANNPNFDEPWVSAVVPGTTDSTGLFTPEQCKQYDLPSNDGNSSYLCGRELPIKNEIKCNRWVYDKYEKTIVQEWSITCMENQYLLALVGTAHFAGIVTGSAAAGVLADK